MTDYTSAKAVFESYLDNYDRENDKVRLKIVHTYGVVEQSSEIAERMGLSDEDVFLARIIALLHDIGRFEQARRFDSFEPSVMDHAAYGVELLFGSQQMIRRFVEENTWDDIIREAILRHSRYEVGDGMDSRTLLHARLIRDADKLDNCRVKLEDRIEVLLGCSAEEAGTQEITPKIWEDCEKRRSVYLADRKTRMDYWVSYIAYFYDLNFPASAGIVLENNYVDRIIGRIPCANRDTAEKMRLLGENVTEFLEELSRSKAAG